MIERSESYLLKEGIGKLSHHQCTSLGAMLGILLLFFSVPLSAEPIFRWQDHSGHWQFSDRPPSQQSYTLVQLTPRPVVAWQPVKLMSLQKARRATRGAGLIRQRKEACRAVQPIIKKLERQRKQQRGDTQDMRRLRELRYWRLKNC